MRPFRSRRFHAGAAAVELALVLLPVLLVAMATLEIGHLLSRHHSLNKRVHDAARYLSGFDPVGDASYATRVTQARNLVAQANTDGTGNGGLGLTDSQIFTCDRHTASNPACPPSSNASPVAGVYTVSVGVSGHAHVPLFVSSGWLQITLPTVMATLPQGY